MAIGPSCQITQTTQIKIMRYLNAIICFRRIYILPIFTVGLFLIGIAVGMYLPAFPAPLSALQPYVGIVLLAVAVFLLVKG